MHFNSRRVSEDQFTNQITCPHLKSASTYCVACDMTSERPCSGDFHDTFGNHELASHINRNITKCSVVNTNEIGRLILILDLLS